MRNIILLIAFCALVCLVQSLNLKSITPFDDGGGIFFPVTNSSAECESAGDCLGEGDDSCDLNCTLADGNCCALGLFCYGNTSTNATCVSNNVGDWCNSNALCFGTYGNVPGGNIAVIYGYGCQDSECTVTYFPGDYCEADTDCNTQKCDTDNNVCLGFAENATCSIGSLQCPYGMSCQSVDGLSKPVCTRLAAEGEACKYDLDCYQGYACISGNCSEAFTAEEGDDCISDISCDEDYVCVGGKCVSGEEWESQSCDTSSDCDNEGICICSKITGEQFCLPTVGNFTNGREALSNVYECVRDNNCTNFGMAPNSCIMENCESDADDTFDQECDFADDAAGDCYYNDACGGFPVWAIVVIVIVAIILVVVIIVVIVMAMRKRRQYDTIA